MRNATVAALAVKRKGLGKINRSASAMLVRYGEIRTPKSIAAVATLGIEREGFDGIDSNTFAVLVEVALKHTPPRATLVARIPSESESLVKLLTSPELQELALNRRSIRNRRLRLRLSLDGGLLRPAKRSRRGSAGSRSLRL